MESCRTAPSLSVSICPTCLLRRVRQRWDADTGVQASLRLHPTTVPVCHTGTGVMMGRITGVSQGQALVLVGGEAGGGVRGDLIVCNFHMDVTRVDGNRGEGDQSHRIVNWRLNERDFFFTVVCQREVSSMLWYQDIKKYQSLGLIFSGRRGSVRPSQKH